VVRASKLLISGNHCLWQIKKSNMQHRNARTGRGSSGNARAKHAASVAATWLLAFILCDFFL
jgi:hypothetical protein